MRTPWQAKVAAKLVLSRLPIGYATWRRLSMFKLGAMEDPDYAISVFERHFRRSGLADAREFTILELGPGDSLGSALIGKAFGAARTYLVDVGPFARSDLAPYRALGAELMRRGLQPPDIGSCETLDDLLATCGAVYMTSGLASLKSLPSGSVDFIWSHAVLEHVERSEFDSTLCEMRRLLKAGGAMSHRIDLQDHLAESLNNLRFSESRWESELFRTSGFYTNRLRPGEILASCAANGFDAEMTDVDTWDHIPLPRTALDADFQGLPDADLRARGMDLIARPRRTSERLSDRGAG